MLIKEFDNQVRNNKAIWRRPNDLAATQILFRAHKEILESFIGTCVWGMVWTQVTCRIWCHMEAFKSLWRILWNTVEWASKHIVSKEKNKSIHSDFQVAAPGREIGESESFFFFFFLSHTHNIEDMLSDHSFTNQTLHLKSRGHQYPTALL